MISTAGVKTFFKKNATPIVVAVVALTVIMLAWRFFARENFAAPLPNIVSQIQTQYANEHARFKAALMLLKPVTGEQQNFVALAKTAMSGALKIAIYDPKDDRAQGPTVVAGAITYPWINSKGTAVVAKDDIEDNVAWAIAHYAGSPGGDLKLSPKRLAAYQYLTAQIPRAPAAKPSIATPSPTAAAKAATTAATTTTATTTASTATAVAAGAAAAAAAVKAAAAKKLADLEAAKKLVRPEDTVVGKVVRTDKPTGAGKMYTYTIEFTPSGKKLATNLPFQTTNANFGAAPKITLDRDGDVLMINGAPYGKWNPLG